MGVPLVIIHFNVFFFHCKASIFGYPILGTPWWTPAASKLVTGQTSQATPHVVFIIWKMQSELRIVYHTWLASMGGFLASLKKWRWVVIRIPKRRTNVWILKQLNSYAACASKACHLDPQNTWPWPSKYSTPKEIGKYSCVNWYVYPLYIYHIYIYYIGIICIYIIYI